MFSTNDTDVSIQLCFTLPNEVRPQQTVSYSLELTNNLSYNSYQQWLDMGSPAQPTEEQLTALLQSSNIEQSQVEPFTPCQVGTFPEAIDPILRETFILKQSLNE